jgi:hypothetical protein
MAVGVDLSRSEHLLARAADRLRLALDDDVQPSGHAVRIEAIGTRHEELQRALVGVLRIIRAERMPSRRAQQGVRMGGHHAQDQPFGRVAIPSCSLPLIHRCSPARAPLRDFPALGQPMTQLAPGGGLICRKLRRIRAGAHRRAALTALERRA